MNFHAVEVNRNADGSESVVVHGDWRSAYPDDLVPIDDTEQAEPRPPVDDSWAKGYMK